MPSVNMSYMNWSFASVLYGAAVACSARYRLALLGVILTLSSVPALASHRHCTAAVALRVVCPLHTATGAWTGALVLQSQCGDTALVTLNPVVPRIGATDQSLGFIGLTARGEPTELSLARLVANNDIQNLVAITTSANLVLDPNHKALRLTSINGKISVASDIVGIETLYSLKRPELKSVEISASGDCKREI